MYLVVTQVDGLNKFHCTPEVHNNRTLRTAHLILKHFHVAYCSSQALMSHTCIPLDGGSTGIKRGLRESEWNKTVECRAEQLPAGNSISFRESKEKGGRGKRGRADRGPGYLEHHFHGDRTSSPHAHLEDSHRGRCRGDNKPIGPAHSHRGMPQWVNTTKHLVLVLRNAWSYYITIHCMSRLLNSVQGELSCCELRNQLV